MWRGKTDNGIECEFFVPMVQVKRTEDNAEFERAQEVAAAANGGGDGDFGQQLVGSFLNGAMNGKHAGPQPAAKGKG